MTEQQELEILMSAYTKAELARMYLKLLKEKERKNNEHCEIH